jgi:predicted acetyltransferase
MFRYELYQPADRERFIKIIANSYVVPSDTVSIALNSFHQPDIRTLYYQDQLIGVLGTLPTAQYFAGQKVDMTGVCSLAIAPEFRGKGGASYLMRSLLNELSQNNVAISTLYPALPQLYRKFGYAFAGGNYTWQIATQQIQFSPKLANNQLAIREISPDLELLESLHAQQAKIHSGHIDRNAWFWSQLLSSSHELAIYLIAGSDQVHGYFICEYKTEGNQKIIAIRDWVLLSQEAMFKFWQFLSYQRSQIQLVEWRSASTDLLHLHLDYPAAQLKHSTLWAVRLVNLVTAWQQRGYPQGISTELHWQVTDPLITGNNGNFVLTIADGTGTAKRGGQGRLKIAISDLAGLFTGFVSAKHLAQLGLLQGDAHAVAIAEAVFSVNPPWMQDFF